MARNKRPAVKQGPPPTSDARKYVRDFLLWLVGNAGLFGLSKMMEGIPGYYFIGLSLLGAAAIFLWDHSKKLGDTGIFRFAAAGLFCGLLVGGVAVYAAMRPTSDLNDANGGFNINGTQFLLDSAASPPKARIVVYFRNVKPLPIRYKFESASIAVDGKPVSLSPYLQEDILPPLGSGSWIPAELQLDDTHVVQVTISYVVRYGFDGRPFTYRQKLQQVCPTMLDPKKFYANQCSRTEMANEKTTSD